MDLGQQPNGNHFPAFDEFNNEPLFPFAMTVCKDCWQVQIEEFPPVDLMFSNHPYITGVNIPVVTHFGNLVSDIVKKLSLPKDSLVIDIGANDGTLLSNFKAAGMRVLGIDPGKRTGELAKANGITICETFWDHSTASAIKKLNVQPRLITATAVFYHVEDIHSFVRGLVEVMQEDTVFVTQCVYLKDVLEKLQFDHFYHEHTMIHAISPLKRLFEEYGLRIIDVDFYEIHGGSFVLYVASNKSNHIPNEVVNKAIENEIFSGLQDITTYKNFTLKVEENRHRLQLLLIQLVAEKKSIYALGAPLKGSTLLNYCKVGPELIAYATEVNPFKIGKFTPGTHIPIVYENSIDKHPDYYLVLSWNFIDFFKIKYDEYLRKGGKFIVPHPSVKIIGLEDLKQSNAEKGN